MSAVVLPAAISHFTSTQVIFSNSTRSVCAHGAAHAGPAASRREAVPPAINISKEFETEPMRMSLLVFRDKVNSVIGLRLFADIDPLGAGELGKSSERDSDRCVGRAPSGHDLLEML